MIEALYIHVPYCISRCAYCDFATTACSDDDRMDAYIDALSIQLRRAARAGLLKDIKTIYIGGGTPTHIGPRRLNSLVYLISLSVNLENVEEYTVEANPESIDERMVKDLYALGVNRVSIGAQSFDDEVLRAYGRAHDVGAISRAVQAVHSRIEDLSLDLICGGPGQSMDSWKQSLHEAVATGAKHISIYPLMMEEGTPLKAAVENGDCTVADEDMQVEMMLCAERILGDAGMQRYEVASYAYPGFESKHNTAYWSGIEYLGLGAGASSMLSASNAQSAFDAGVFQPQDPFSSEDRDMIDLSSRIRIVSNVDDVAFALSNGHPAVEVEVLTSYEAHVEDLMLTMRKSSGAPSELVSSVLGAKSVFEELIVKGLVLFESGSYVPTERGWLLGNEIFGAIWSLTEG